MKTHKRPPRKRALKEKLSLTISAKMRTKVQAIAKREHRSVSSLFEYWIDLEWRKLKAERKPPDPRTDSGIYRLSSPPELALR